MNLESVHTNLDNLEYHISMLLFSLYDIYDLADDPKTLDACDKLSESFRDIHDIIYRAANGLN